jgi:hypothetical protein
LCVDLTYDGSVRRIEAYSLRQTLEGKLVLHAIRSDSGAHRSYRVDWMQGAAVTSQVFSPRYFVELTSADPCPSRHRLQTRARRALAGKTDLRLPMLRLPENIQQENDGQCPEPAQIPSRLSMPRTGRDLCAHESLAQS